MHHNLSQDLNENRATFQKIIYQVRGATAAVDKVRCRVVILRIVVGGDGARVVSRQGSIVRPTARRLLRQDLDQLSQEVVGL